MNHWLVREFSGRGMSVVIGLLLGSVITWLLARWRRLRERRNIAHGDARDTVVIHQHLVASEGEGASRRPTTLRIRTIGQSELNRVAPNGYLASELLSRSFRVTPRDTLISMESTEGSYLLETLTNFVCDCVANAPFEHDLYVMAPCCEPAGMAQHQPITILLIAVSDLALFEDWPACRSIRIEHGSDGVRILTLREMARRFRQEQEKLVRLRKSGQRTQHVETMYILDLALDRRAADIPTKPVPWGRFESVLQELNLE